MSGHHTIVAQRFDAGRRPAEPAAPRHRRFLLIAALLSVAVHLAAALVLVLLPRFLPSGAPPKEQGTIELLMVEQKGAQPNQSAQSDQQKAAPVPPPKPAPPEKPEAAAPDTEPPVSASTASPAPQLPEHGEEPPPAPSGRPPPEAAKPDAAPDAKEARPEPVPPGPQKAPVFDLEGTESESNAIAMGDRILPAMPDDRFRNRPPAYPLEAQMNNQHGEVVVTIHVSEDGLASGADITESSGVRALDQAVLAAVRKWHFHPALKEGQAVPFDMPFRFVFEPN